MAPSCFYDLFQDYATHKDRIIFIRDNQVLYSHILRDMIFFSQKNLRVILRLYTYFTYFCRRNYVIYVFNNNLFSYVVHLF